MLKNIIFILSIIITCNTLPLYAVNMMVRPNALTSLPPQQTMPAQSTSSQTTSPVAPVPQPPPAPPTEKSVTIINATPFLMNVRFETNTNPGVVDSIPANSSKKITYKINSLIMYSFEQLASKPITPDMISQDAVTIKTPPELIPTPVQAPTSAQASVKSALSDTLPVTAPAMIMPTQQLPASASSKGPPGYKAERQ
jgi:hypothetical protein